MRKISKYASIASSFAYGISFTLAWIWYDWKLATIIAIFQLSIAIKEQFANKDHITIEGSDLKYMLSNEKNKSIH